MPTIPFAHRTRFARLPERLKVRPVVCATTCGVPRTGHCSARFAPPSIGTPIVEHTGRSASMGTTVSSNDACHPRIVGQWLISPPQGLGGLCPASATRFANRVSVSPSRGKIHGRRRCPEAIEWRRFEAPKQGRFAVVVGPCLDVRREKGSIQSTFVAAHAIKSAKPSARGMCVSEEDTFHGWCGRIETLLAHCARGPRFKKSLSGVKHLLHPSPSTISSAFQYRHLRRNLSRKTTCVVAARSRRNLRPPAMP